MSKDTKCFPPTISLLYLASKKNSVETIERVLTLLFDAYGEVNPIVLACGSRFSEGKTTFSLSAHPNKPAITIAKDITKVFSVTKTSVEDMFKIVYDNIDRYVKKTLATHPFLSDRDKAVLLEIHDYLANNKIREGGTIPGMAVRAGCTIKDGKISCNTQESKKEFVRSLISFLHNYTLKKLSDSALVKSIHSYASQNLCPNADEVRINLTSTYPDYAFKTTCIYQSNPNGIARALKDFSIIHDLGSSASQTG